MFYRLEIEHGRVETNPLYLYNNVFVLFEKF